MSEQAFIGIIIITILLFSAWYFLKPFLPQMYCEKDEDCVPAQCCHPTSCVNEEPDCTAIACTEECRTGTMDCGCGSCICRDNKCVVAWNETIC